MGRKCPRGTICIENITLIFLIIIIFFAVYLFNKIKDNKVIIMQQQRPPMVNHIQQNDSFPKSVFLDPHVMPVRETRAYTKDMTDPRGIPINIRTQGVDAPFRQVGILTRNGNGETILPLMGRPLQTNRDKHQFYTMNDKNHMIKLPISKNGRSCSAEYGCDEIFNGDTVYIEGYNDSFKATIYENNVPEYIPFI